MRRAVDLSELHSPRIQHRKLGAMHDAVEIGGIQSHDMGRRGSGNVIALFRGHPSVSSMAKFGLPLPPKTVLRRSIPIIHASALAGTDMAGIQVERLDRVT